MSRLSRSGIKSIAINVAYLSSARFITSLSRAFYAVILSYFLGAELYGLFNYGLSWYVLFVPVSVLGLNGIIIREIGRDRSQAESLVGQTLTLRTISTFVVSFLSVLLAWLIEADPLPRQLLFIFSAALFGRGLSLWANAVFQAYESSGYVMGMEVSFRLLEVLVGVGLLYAGYGVVTIAIVHAASWVLQGMMGLALIRLKLFKAWFSWDSKIQLSLFKRGMPFIVSSFLIGWLFQGPIIMFRHLEGFGIGLGQLALALQAFFIIGAVVSELGGAALPVLARSIDRGDGKSGYFIDLVLRGGALMSGILSIVALIIGPWLVDWLFGNDYDLTASLLPWTLLLVALYFWVNTLSNVMVAHGKYPAIMLNNAVGAVILTLSFPFLVSAVNMLGVVIALALGLFGSVVAHLYFLQSYYIEGFFNTLFRSVSAILLAVSITVWLLSFSPWLASIIGLFSLFGAFALFGMFRAQEVKWGVELIRSKLK